MNPQKVLLVGQSASCAALRALLSSHCEYHVAAEAASLREARRALVRGTIHLVFLAPNLPDEDGLGLLDAIPPGARVVIVSADDSPDVQSVCFDPPNYLLKSVNRSALADVLTQVQHSRRTFETVARMPAWLETMCEVAA